MKSKLVNLLWDIAEAEGSNSEADVTLASLAPPTDGIMLAAAQNLISIQRFCLQRGIKLRQLSESQQTNISDV